MQWLKSVTMRLRPGAPGQSGDLPARREAELRERYERLERMAIEADVISRTDRPEGQQWDGR